MTDAKVKQIAQAIYANVGGPGCTDRKTGGKPGISGHTEPCRTATDDLYKRLVPSRGQ